MRHKCKNLKRRSKQAGITLVALVVTVVILLILAGISIYLVLDNNGIIAKADEARDKSAIEAIREARVLWNTEAYLGSDESLSDYLFRQGLITEEEKTIVDNEGKISRGDYKFSFKETLVEMFKAGKLQVGDWVSYKNPTKVSADVKATDSSYSDTGYTSLAERTGMSVADGYSEDINQNYSLANNGVQVNWRVLGLSEDGTQLMLTTGSPLQRTWDSSKSNSASNSKYFYLRGAKGCAYDYGITELNKICAIYKNDFASEARSLTIDDINRLCNVTVDIKNKKVINSKSEDIDRWGNIGTELALVNPYQNQEGYLYQSPEDYIDGIVLGQEETIRKTSDTYYYYGEDAIDRTSALYDILFKGSESNKFYWLASRGTYVSDYDLSYNWGPGNVRNHSAASRSFGMLYSSGIQNIYDMQGADRKNANLFNAVRPVVYLKSDVTINDIQNIGIQTSGEEAWDNNWL